ncbi:glycine-rich protein 23-like [Dendrobium catenatum]|uniref:glycine-rich protein 23-like n=1 Tax=Dendrobium catenatum TaxID=906689 RepID=UPI00109FC07B|nr:glycine-rich protein 23-like [Dendrobium catenatum]
MASYIVMFVAITFMIVLPLIFAGCKQQKAEAQPGQNVVYYGNQAEHRGLGSGNGRRDIESGLDAVAGIGRAIDDATSNHDCGGGGGGCLCGGGGDCDGGGGGCGGGD